MRSILALILFLLACLGVAAFGAQFTPGEWYVGLEKPSWNPPACLFGPVWTVLYAMMAVAGWLVWRTGTVAGGGDSGGAAGAAGAGGRRLALAVFALQLVLNGAWSWLFFGLHRPGLAFAEIVTLWLAILATTVLFWKQRPLAGALLLPYLAWVSFAAALNFELWRLSS
jgi:tryptophan-rich sensory protein